jgi:hypothetical protein
MLVLAATRSLPVEILLVAGYILTVAAFGKVARERRRLRPAVIPVRTSDSPAELERMPGRNGSELEERAAATGIAVSEVADTVLPADLQQALLDAVIEPRAPEDELAEPVHEGLAVDDADPLPVTDEIDAESAARLVDAPVGRELDEIRGLVDFEFVPWNESELDRGRGHALLEVEAAEGEAIAEKLDDVVLAGRVVGLGHRTENSPLDEDEEDGPPLEVPLLTVKRIAQSVLVCSVVILAVAAVIRVPAGQAPLLAPVVLALFAAVVTLLSVRSRRRAAGDEPS